MKPAILFDLDGTLWDAADAVSFAWNRTLDRVAPDIAARMTPARMRGYMGQSMEQIADDFLKEAPRERRLALLRQCCEEENAYVAEHGGILFPGLEDTLRELHGRYALGIVSNCQAGYIEAFFAHHGLQRYFDDYENPGRTGLLKADNIALVRSRNGYQPLLYVGDTQGDCDAAAEAGVPFVHAAYGFGRIDRRVPAITAVTQLPALAGELLGC